jgi:L-2,4-diaminobutyrate decarboxylase
MPRAQQPEWIGRRRMSSPESEPSAAPLIATLPAAMQTAEFLSAAPDAMRAYEAAVAAAATLLTRTLPSAPYSGAAPAELRALLNGPLVTRHGSGLAQTLADVETIVKHSIVVSNPNVAAHLHCPPLIASLAAEVVLTALNQSMDSFDQAPAATIVEEQVTDWLCHAAGLPDSAGGTFTSGGTQSNYMGLWLARDAWLRDNRGWSVRERGLPPDAGRLAILCSEVSHFTVDKAAIQLGLGTNAVVRVAADSAFRMDPDALREAVIQLAREGRVPMAIVATVGTTDFGSIDPLDALSDVARECHAWLHVDAAYGGALMFSRTRRSVVAAMARADSIGLDFHKLLWQSVSCGAFLLRDSANYALLATHADYLNPERHEAEGIPDLVNRSLATTRRFDALKVWMTFRALGSERMSALIEQVCALAQYAAKVVSAHPELELVHVSAALSCVLFRWRAASDADADVHDADAITLGIRDDLFNRGIAVVGVTTVRGRVCLKLTVLNPLAERADFDTLVDAIVISGTAQRARLHTSVEA